MMPPRLTNGRSPAKMSGITTFVFAETSDTIHERLVSTSSTGQKLGHFGPALGNVRQLRPRCVPVWNRRKAALLEASFASPDVSRPPEWGPGVIIARGGSPFPTYFC